MIKSLIYFVGSIIWFLYGLIIKKYDKHNKIMIMYINTMAAIFFIFSILFLINYMR